MKVGRDCQGCRRSKRLRSSRGGEEFIWGNGDKNLHKTTSLRNTWEATRSGEENQALIREKNEP